MSCRCQKCGNQYKLDIYIPNDIWKRISPKKDSSGLLCGKCIFEELEKIFGYAAFKLINFKSLKLY